MNATQKRKYLRILVLIIALGIVIVGIQQWLSHKEEAPADNGTQPTTAKPALTVEQVKPQRTMMHSTIIANGSIAAWQEAMIGAEVNGLAIKEVLVNVGDQVKRGQVIARFNDSTIQADLAQAQANVAEAKAAMLEAEGNAQRARSIQESGALSRQQIEQYLSSEASTKARYQSAQAALNAQSIKQTQTQLVAPDNGVISKRDATVGQVVSAGLELFRLIRQGRIEWRGEFNAENISKIEPGMDVKLTLPDSSQINGKVRSLAPTADSSTRNTLVYVDIPNQKARAGMFAKGEIQLAAAETNTLPYSAIVMRDGFNFVMQIDDSHHIRQLKVTLGNREGNLVEIMGLQDTHANYVASGGAFLSDGDLVRIADEAVKH